MSELWTDEKVKALVGGTLHTADSAAWMLCQLRNQYEAERTKLAEANAAQAQRIKYLQEAYMQETHEVEQALGKALNYPRYCDDPAIFPNATESDGVIVIEQTLKAMAEEAAARIAELEKREALFRAWFKDEFATTDEQIDLLLGIQQ